ncbi:MAG: 2-amino-4-hydroxy-6-hydroxymethyldihydropteridine diphosphokinase [Dehalococcoidales bacterium]|nr:2-amino-4-hydroxy-6-hydroxymethyldihydropteridine diphosphokinase [Dehalococcoidales bacterium]
MEIKTASVYLGLGSNMGEKQDNLLRALDYISQRLRIEKKSSMYDTAPVGNINQARFLNMVCEVTTSLPPAMLLATLKGIESKMGRLPVHPANSPRIIDIDILLYGDEIIDTPDLKIPHPRLAERAFVLVPLAEIAPELVHPVLKLSMKDLLTLIESNTQGVLKLQFQP